MRNVLVIAFSCLCLMPLSLRAQESLDLEKAIQLGLENNLQIKIAVDNAEVRDLELKAGKGLLLPVVNSTYLRSYSNEDVTQRFLNDPAPREIDGAESRNSNFNIAGVYGFRPDAVVSIKRLGQLAEIGELESKVTVENTIAGISTAYYRLILEQQRYQVLKETLRLSKNRLEIAQSQYELGGAGKRDFLTAQVDYNADSSLLLTQEQIIQNAQVNLNELLAIDPNTTFLIRDSITIAGVLSLEELEENAFLENKQLLVNQRQKNVAFLQTRELQAQRLPVLNFNGSYVNNTLNSDAGFLIQNQRSGFNYGGSVTINLFSGLTLNRRIQSAKVNQRIVDNTVEQFEIQLKSDIRRAYNTYENNIALLEIEKRNFAVAKENTEIALERFRLGIASYLEFRDAQVNLLTAENRLITSIYNIKEQEIELLRLSGKIFFENANEEFVPEAN